jgi:hypothetical protein
VSPISDWADDLPTVQIQRLVEAADPRGPEYGTSWQPVGTPIPALSQKLDSAQLQRRGKEENVLRWKLFMDLLPDGTAPLDETTDRVAHPDGGELDVLNVVPYSSEGLAKAEAERTV